MPTCGEGRKNEGGELTVQVVLGYALSLIGQLNSYSNKVDRRIYAFQNEHTKLQNITSRHLSILVTMCLTKMNQVKKNPKCYIPISSPQSSHNVQKGKGIQCDFVC